MLHLHLVTNLVVLVADGGGGGLLAGRAAVGQPGDRVRSLRLYLAALGGGDHHPAVHRPGRQNVLDTGTLQRSIKPLSAASPEDASRPPPPSPCRCRRARPGSAPPPAPAPPPRGRSAARGPSPPCARGMSLWKTWWVSPLVSGDLTSFCKYLCVK